MKKIFTVLIALPAALILVSLALANRTPTRMALNPFRPEDSMLSITMPLYAYLLLALIAGVALGGVATWFNQGQWRRTARNRTHEARRWQSETERLVRERDDMVGAAKDGERGKRLAIAR